MITQHLITDLIIVHNQMAHKHHPSAAFSSLFLDLEAIRQHTNDIRSEALSAKERTVLEHERLKSDPRLSPFLFTHQERYRRGRERIVYGDKIAAATREQADLNFYQTLMSNKYKTGSDFDRKQPHLFLTRDQLANGNIRRLMTKYSREFGGTPIEQGKKPILKSKLSHFPTQQESTSRPELNWRHDVNEYVLGCVGKIYSPQFRKKNELQASLTSFLSAPGSPQPKLGHHPGRKRLTFSQFLGEKGSKIQNISDGESINLKQEIQTTRVKIAEQKLKLGYSRARNLERLKPQPKLKHLNK